MRVYGLDVCGIASVSVTWVRDCLREGGLSLSGCVMTSLGAAWPQLV